MSKSIFYPLFGMMMFGATPGWGESLQHPENTIPVAMNHIVFSLIFWGTAVLLAWAVWRVLAFKSQGATTSRGVWVGEIGWVLSAAMPLGYLVLQFPWVLTLG